MASPGMPLAKTAWQEVGIHPAGPVHEEGRKAMETLRNRSAKALAGAMVTAVAVSLGVGEVKAQDLTLPVSYQVAESSRLGEFGAPVLVLATSASEWDHAMMILQKQGRLMVTPGRSSQDVPVDWTSQAVILVALGSYPNEQYSVEVSQVQGRGAELLVSVHIDLDHPYEQAMTSPYVMVTVAQGGWKSARAHYDVPAGFAEQSLDVSAVPTTVLSWGGVKDLYR